MSEQSTQFKVDELIETYLAIRDRIEMEEKQLEENHKPLKEAMAAIENWFLARANAEAPGDQKWSIALGTGTAFRKKSEYVQVEDWPSFWSWCVQHPEHAEMVKKSVASSKVLEFAAANAGALPPGLRSGARFEIQIRRKK